MASNTSYHPVGIEEDMRHDSPNHRRRYYDHKHPNVINDPQNRTRNKNSRTRSNYNANHIDRDSNGNYRPLSHPSSSRFPPEPSLLSPHHHHHHENFNPDHHNANNNDSDHQSLDEGDGILGLPKIKKPRGMIGVCCFSLIALVIGVVFLLGVCLGFYVRETQQGKVDLDQLCKGPERPIVDYAMLGGYHETLMYYIRGEEVRKFVDEFGTHDPVTGSELEKRLEARVLEEFNAHKMDSVKVEEHEILVTYPDPAHPNRLQVLHASNGSLLHAFEFSATGSSSSSSSSSSPNSTTTTAAKNKNSKNSKASSSANNTVTNANATTPDNNASGNVARLLSPFSSSQSSSSSPSFSGSNSSGPRAKRDNRGNDRTKRDNRENAGTKGEKRENDEYAKKWWRHPHVAFCPPGSTKAPLVYAHYGLKSDFDILESLGIPVSGRTVLVSMGKVSVADKILESQKRGAVSVLLYWEAGDHVQEKGSHILPHHVPYASAATYIEDHPILWTPSIPCQTISTEQAQSLIALMDANLHSSGSTTTTATTPLSDSDVDGDSDSSRQRGPQESVLVELIVNHKYRRQKVRNIIATILGTEEPDRYTIVGAPRSSLPSSPSQDIVVSTSILSQLVASIHYLHNLHLWRPRRGVKVVSWGGAEFSNAGILTHIMKRQHILPSRALAYIDVGHLVSGNETVGAQATSSLHQLLREVAFDIRDPRDEGETIQSRWLQQSKMGNPGGMYGKVSGFGTDNTLYPFLHLLGIPTARAQFQGKPNSIQPESSSLHRYSYDHHYKFHIAMSRVLVMVVLNLADVEMLPVNLETVAGQLESTLWQTSAVLEDCTNEEATLEHVVLLGENLKQTTRAFEELARNYRKRNDTSGITMVNTVKMRMERIFVSHHRGTPHHMLYPTNPDGSLQHATHLCESYGVSRTLGPVLEFVGALERIVQEAELMLKIGA